MSLQLLSITDPRDNLEKARRRELVAFARAHGQKDINDEMPAILIRRILRSRGLTQIAIPKRVLGSTAGPKAAGDALADAAIEAPKVDMEDDLARQYGIDPNSLTSAPESEQSPPPKPPRPPGPPNILVQRTNLMRECKAKGIKCSRKDTVETLKAKLGGQIAA